MRFLLSSENFRLIGAGFGVSDFRGRIFLLLLTALFMNYAAIKIQRVAFSTARRFRGLVTEFLPNTAKNGLLGDAEDRQAPRFFRALIRGLKFEFRS